MKTTSARTWGNRITFTIIHIFIVVGYCIELTSCGPSKVELEAREMARLDSIKEQQQIEDVHPEKRLAVDSDSSATDFNLKLGEGTYQYGRLITVKHDGCEYVIWFNEQGQQVMHKPNCINPIHNK